MPYGLAIDMWSLGCILAEMLTGYPIFPGENEQEQLACIMEIFGPPERSVLAMGERQKVFFDSSGKPRPYISSKGRRHRVLGRTLQQAIKCDDEKFVDFLAQCFRWDPRKRLSPEQALHHPFVAGETVLFSRTTADMPPSASSKLATPRVGRHNDQQPLQVHSPAKNNGGAQTENGARNLRAVSYPSPAKAQTAAIPANSKLVYGTPRRSHASLTVSTGIPRRQVSNAAGL